MSIEQLKKLRALCNDSTVWASVLDELIAIRELKGDQVPVALTVWYGSMPESNGKENWTAILHRKGEGKLDGITIDRSEYPGRVLYAADRARYLIGEKEDRPHILSYDGDKRSDYIYPVTAPQKPVVLPGIHMDQWGDEFYFVAEVHAAIEAAGGIVSTSDQRLMQDMSGIMKDGE